MPRLWSGLGRVAYRLHPGDLVFCTGRLLQPDKRGLAFLGRAATAGGVLQTRPRPFDNLRVAQCRRAIGIGHTADRPPAHPEQVADLLLTVGTGQERPDRESGNAALAESPPTDRQKSACAQ